MQPEPTTHAIQREGLASSGKWFDYPVRAHPHHTDYAGVVWHGSYIAWMEAARVECLRSLGVNFEDLVALGCDLPVVDLSIRYHRAMLMGAPAIVRTRILKMRGVRLNWDYRIESADGSVLYITALVSLVAIDRAKGKIMRQLPPAVREALMRIAQNP